MLEEVTTTQSVVSYDDSSISVPSVEVETSDKLKVSFRLPNMETIKIDLSGLEALFVRDLKRRLNGCGVVIPFSRMKLVYGTRVIRDHELIGDVCFKSGDIVFVIISMIPAEEVAPKYDDFILSTQPKHLAVNVPVDAELSITLRANLFNEVIVTDALIAAESKVCSLNSGDMLRNLNGDSMLAENKGYRKWIHDKELRGKVVLLQVSEDLDMRLEDIRYNVDGINTGYNKGDDDSWQRYTNELPIPCNIIVSSFFDPPPHLIRIFPREMLQPNTQYAILLRNNAPVRPFKLPHYSVDFFSDSVGDDKIIMFKTEKLQSKSDGKLSPDRCERRRHLLS